ncbi:unnamed protein product [Calypogeia fissa]
MAVGSLPLLPVATPTAHSVTHRPTSAIPCCSLTSAFHPRSLNLSSKSSFTNGAELSHARSDGARGFAPALCNLRVVTVRADGAQEEARKTSPTTGFRTKSPKDTNVVIVGATGYIGKFVVKEMVKRGYNVIAVSREKSGIGGRSDKEKTQAELAGATVCFSNVTDAAELEKDLKTSRGGGGVDVVISCLASRGGGVKDSWLVDYTATRNSLDAGRALGASHFVLLSAICVQKPLLEFQKAKLKFEAELQAMAMEEEGEGSLGLTYSIVRPTAFFKSLGGQVKSVQGGGPYVMFGDGALTACKPISEADLARFIADCLSDEEKVNKLLPIGGPGKAMTPLEQGEILFRILGKEPKFIKVPIQIMDFFIGQLDFWKKFFPNLEDAAEFGKIGRYYAAESMLLLNPETGKYDADATPSYGTDTLEDFFERVVRHGMVGQELGDQAVF